MTINKLLEIIASENKLKIIAHYFDCTCKDNSRCVGDLQEELGLTQSNLSKHLALLKKEKVLDVVTKHKQRIYSINKDFRKEWFDILEPIVSQMEIKKYKCKHCQVR